MKSQNHHDAQDDDALGEFEAWINSPEGQAWLEGEEERAGSWWTHDGFNPEVGHA